MQWVEDGCPSDNEGPSDDDDNSTHSHDETPPPNTNDDVLPSNQVSTSDSDFDEEAFLEEINARLNAVENAHQQKGTRIIALFSRIV